MKKCIKKKEFFKKYFSSQCYFESLVRYFLIESFIRSVYHHKHSFSFSNLVPGKIYKWNQIEKTFSKKILRPLEKWLQQLVAPDRRYKDFRRQYSITQPFNSRLSLRRTSDFIQWPAAKPRQSKITHHITALGSIHERALSRKLIRVNSGVKFFFFSSRHIFSRAVFLHSTRK